MKLEKFPKNPLGSPLNRNPNDVSIATGNRSHHTKARRGISLPNLVFSNLSNGFLVGINGQSHEELTREKIFAMLSDDNSKGYELIVHKVDENIEPMLETTTLTYAQGRKIIRIGIERREDDKYYFVRR